MKLDVAGPARLRLPRLRLPRKLRRRLVDAAADACPDEICGALLGTAEPGGARVLEFVPLANRSGEPRRSYRVDPADLEPLLRRGGGREGSGGGRDGSAAGEVIGFYHSHPSGPAALSDRDAADAWPQYWYVVVAPNARAAERTTAWRNAEAARIGG